MKMKAFIPMKGKTSFHQQLYKKVKFPLEKLNFVERKELLHDPTITMSSYNPTQNFFFIKAEHSE